MEPGRPTTRPLRMPAEWELQEATWLSWPQNIETCPKNLREAQLEFVDLIRAIADSQSVFVLCDDEQATTTLKQLASIPRLQLVPIPTNDAWIRDYGPTFVVDESADGLVAINWHYNAWGGKYPPYDLDQKVAQRVAEFLGIDCTSVNLCFEGGAIDINSKGIALSTTSCVLDDRRNPGRTLEAIEQLIKDVVGITEMVWLPGDGIEGDDTDGHIDQLARFTDDSNIVHAWTDSPSDCQRSSLSRNVESLNLEAERLGSLLSNLKLTPPSTSRTDPFSFQENPGELL